MTRCPSPTPPSSLPSSISAVPWAPEAQLLRSPAPHAYLADVWMTFTASSLNMEDSKNSTFIISILPKPTSYSTESWVSNNNPSPLVHSSMGDGRFIQVTEACTILSFSYVPVETMTLLLIMCTRLCYVNLGRPKFCSAAEKDCKFVDRNSEKGPMFGKNGQPI